MAGGGADICELEGGAGLLGGTEMVVARTGSSLARSGAFNMPDRPEEIDGWPDVSVSVLDGGPGGSEVNGVPVRDARRRAGSESVIEPQSSP